MPTCIQVKKDCVLGMCKGGARSLWTVIPLPRRWAFLVTIKEAWRQLCNVLKFTFLFWNFLDSNVDNKELRKAQANGCSLVVYHRLSSQDGSVESEQNEGIFQSCPTSLPNL